MDVDDIRLAGLGEGTLARRGVYQVQFRFEIDNCLYSRFHSNKSSDFNSCHNKNPTNCTSLKNVLIYYYIITLFSIVSDVFRTD
jgi:hypothetical protein